MKSARKNRSAQRRRIRAGRTGGSVIPHPPQISKVPAIWSTRLRFLCNGASQIPISFRNLLDTMVMSGTTGMAATLYDLYFSVKVKFVEIWCASSTNIVGGGQTPLTVSVTFASTSAGFVGSQRMFQDTSIGGTEPAHVKGAPGADSLASKFQTSSAGEAFYLICPAGSVIDVMVTFVAPALGEVVPAQNTGSAVAGQQYWRGLDGLAINTTAFVPANISSTA